MNEKSEPKNKTSDTQYGVRFTRQGLVLFWPSSTQWVAIFTGVLTLFTFLLYRGSERAEENRRRTMRAIVSFTGITPSIRKNISKDGKVWESVRVGFNLINGGFTPTREMRIKINHQLFQGEPPLDFAFGDLDNKPPSVLTLGPSVSGSAFVTVPIGRFTAAARGERLYFWGWVTYRDVFPHSPPRLTEFCGQAVNVTFTKPDSPNDPKGNLRFDVESCPQHNCYDEDCPDYAAQAKSARQTESK